MEKKRNISDVLRSWVMKYMGHFILDFLFARYQDNKSIEAEVWLFEKFWMRTRQTATPSDLVKLFEKFQIISPITSETQLRIN